MSEQENPLQGYYEWQVATLMLAYDLAQPIPQGSDEQVDARREQVSQEINDMVQGLLPQAFKDDPTKNFPPELMMTITRATLRRAMDIAGL